VNAMERAAPLLISQSSCAQTWRPAWGVRRFLVGLLAGGVADDNAILQQVRHFGDGKEEAHRLRGPGR